MAQFSLRSIDTCLKMLKNDFEMDIIGQKNIEKLERYKYLNLGEISANIE